MNEETNFNLFESDDESDNYLIFYNSLLNNRIIFKKEEEEEKQKEGKENLNNSDKDEKNLKVKFVVVNEKNEQIIQSTLSSTQFSLSSFI
mgnify:CR=1 FL=1